MKRQLFSLLCIFITSFCVYAQKQQPSAVDDLHATDILEDQGCISDNGIENTNTTPFNYKNSSEWNKYKVLRAVGWSALGVGIPGTIVSFFGVAISINTTNKLTPLWTGLFYTSAALTLSSIPILITAYHYRRKAKKMSLNIGVSQISKFHYTNKIECTPALSLALNF